MNKKVAALVVTYNRKKLLKECIDSLLLQSVKPDIFIVDNNSTDGTFSLIKNYICKHQINYINTGRNLGGAGGFQFGIKLIAQKNYEYVWIMDDDCIPQGNSLSNLLRAGEKLNNEFGFLSSKVIWKNGKLCTMNVQRKTLIKKVTDFLKKMIPIKMASFVSLLVPIKIVRKIGLPIKEFFIWTDDWEYTRRISLKYPCYLVTNSVVLHKTKNNFGANIASDDVERIPRYKYLYRNDVYLYRREGVKGFLYEFVRIVDHTLRVILKAKNNKFKRLKMIYKGTIKGLSFKPRIEYVNKK